MLGKLLKFELKASARTLLPMYAGTLLLALVCGISQAIRMSNQIKIREAITESMNSGTAVTITTTGTMSGTLDMFIVFSMILVFAFCVAVTVLTITTVVQRFNKGVTGDEGYLMFTLPITHTKLLASKLLGALVWIITSMIVFFLVGVIIGGSTILVQWEYFDWPLLWSRVTGWLTNWNVMTSVLITLLGSVAALVAAVLTAYLAMMVGQMEQFSKYRIVAGVVTFFAVGWVSGIVGDVLMGISTATPEYGFIGSTAVNLSDVFDAYNQAMLMQTALSIVTAAACFFGTTWMMKKKLNL